MTDSVALGSFSQPLEVRQDPDPGLPRIPRGEPADDLPDRTIGELDVVVKSESAAGRRGLDLPTLIVALEVPRRHAVSKDFILHPFCGLEMEPI